MNGLLRLIHPYPSQRTFADRIFGFDNRTRCMGAAGCYRDRKPHHPSRLPRFGSAQLIGAITSELNGIALRLEVEATDAKTKASPVGSPLSRKKSSTLLAANHAPGSSRVQLLSEILAPAQKPASSLRDNNQR